MISKAFSAATPGPSASSAKATAIRTNPERFIDTPRTRQPRARLRGSIMGHRLASTFALLALLGARSAPATPMHEAVRQVGTAYHWGGRSPKTGFDCSGLVAHAFARAWGLELPHNAHAQSKA